MLHTKSQGHWPSDSVENFKQGSNTFISGHGGHLDHGTRTICINCELPIMFIIDPEFTAVLHCSDWLK